jgi:bla regulator protein blaR1
MNKLSQFFETEWIQALGWTLLHSLWQGVLLALLLAIVLIILRKGSANIRYLAGIFTLTTLLAVMVFTFNLEYSPPQVSELINYPEKTSYYAFVETGESSTLDLEPSIQITEETSLGSIFISYFEEHMPFIMLLYLIGVLILTMRMFGELVYIQNLRYSRSKPATEVWQQKLLELANKMGVAKSIVLKESIRVNSPMVIGFLKPMVFVPIGLLSNLPANQIESILAHELAHIRRHDYLTNLLQSFVETLLFFNPAVWWISSFIRSEREHCCDDIAIDLTGDELTFARTLANLEEWRMQNGSLVIAFSGNRKSGILGRIQRLLEKKESTQLPFRLFWGSTILTIGLLLAVFNANNASILKNSNSNNEIEPIEEVTMETQVFESKFAEELNNEIADVSNIEFAVETQEINTAKPSLSANSVVSNDLPDSNDFQLKTQTPRDTVPDHVKKLEKEMRDLEQSFRQKREELSKQMKELELKRYAIEKDVQKQDFEMQTAQLEVQKAMQKMEKEKIMLERDLELKQNSQEEIIMELEFKMQNNELFLEENQRKVFFDKENNEELIKEVEKRKKESQETRKAILLQQQEMKKIELKAKKKAILKEKEMQEVMYNNQLLEHEKQLSAHSKDGDLLQLAESRRLIEMQMAELEFEFQSSIQQLKQKIEMEYQKIAKEEY